MTTTKLALLLLAFSALFVENSIQEVFRIRSQNQVKGFSMSKEGIKIEVSYVMKALKTLQTYTSDAATHLANLNFEKNFQLEFQGEYLELNHTKYRFAQWASGRHPIKVKPYRILRLFTVVWLINPACNTYYSLFYLNFLDSNITRIPGLLLLSEYVRYI